ncbi:MAG TPA: hypothetical protein DIV54_08055 [Verrucomicrobiales bacterium]|nr:hypothetical protein [Verrucomicrobiales bacterium]
MQAQAGNQSGIRNTPSSVSSPLATDPGCLGQTCALLEEHGLATPAELKELRHHGHGPLKGPRPWDPLEFLAALRIREPEARALEVERLGRSLSHSLGQPLALIPFASRMQTPSVFYDMNEALLADCRKLMTPVLYAEESEVIGIGSINPAALQISTRTIMQFIADKTGTTPIVSSVLLHHEGWISLCQQQFGI